MHKFLKRLKYVLFAGDALDALIKQEQRKIEDAEREANRHRLQLCFKHRQEPNHSDYGENNCDYCRLQRHNHHLLRILDTEKP